MVARTLATALGEMSRLAHERALCSSTGLTPRADAAGASMRRGHLSRQGASRLRHGRVETAWRARPRAPILHAIDRIAATRGTQRARVAMARRLMGRRRACFRHGTTSAVGTAGETLAHDGRPGR